jgi:acetylornithine deacetylase
MTVLEKHIDLLVQTLAIPAMSRNEDTRATFLQRWLGKQGLTVIRNRNNLVVTGGNDPARATLLLNSHLDTVAPVAGWSTDPYLPVNGNGRITGLGSNDAGASVVSLIATYRHLVETGLAEKVVLVISAEEEVSGSHGISAVLPQLPDLKFAVVGEPTGMQPAVAERGLMVVDAVASGISGHAARQEGDNAIYHAMEDIEKIRNLTFDDHSDWLWDPSVSVTMIQAGTGHNVVPDTCEFVIDVRSNDRYTNELLFEMLARTCASKLVPRSMRLRSSSLPKEHPAFRVIESLGMMPFGSPTLSDMALLNIPSVKIGPGDSARSHTANEYVFVSEIEEAIDRYTAFLEQLIKLAL